MHFCWFFSAGLPTYKFCFCLNFFLSFCLNLSRLRLIGLAVLKIMAIALEKDAKDDKKKEEKNKKTKTVDIRWLSLTDPETTVMKKMRVVEQDIYAKFGWDWLSGLEDIGNSVGGGGGRRRRRRRRKKVILKARLPQRGIWPINQIQCSMGTVPFVFGYG